MTGGNFPRQGNILKSLAKVLGSCGSGPLPSGYQLPKADPTPIQFKTAYQQGTTQRQRATADLTMVAFYYLLQEGEDTVKGLWNNTKQTVQFKYEDITFFKKNNRGELRASRGMLLRISSHLTTGPN